MKAEVAKPKWKKVKEIFHEALRLAPAEREVFLDRACEDDIDLRIEVESLLFSLDEAKSFLEEPPTMVSAERDVSWQFKNGDTVSHYRIVEQIGVGGMGQVYLAEDQKLRRQVALKVLPSEVLEDSDRLRRFKREAMAVSALNHPNILTIFEFDEFDSIPLLASEYVKGGTLRDSLRKGRLEIGAVLDVAVQVASALQTAHAAGVIHRDIKPENIMIRDDGYVKVLDFGLAKLTGNLRAQETDAARTQAFSLPGIMMGTATYMSPEQARCKSVDTRTDIFSFGIVLYEMLTGRTPFSGDTTTDIIAEIIQKDPVPPNLQNPSVPDELNRVTIKCLEKDRNDRYQTAADLLVDLRKLSTTENTRTATSDARTELLPAEEPLQAPIGRAIKNSSANDGVNKFRFAALAAGVTLIVAVVAGYWYFNHSEQIGSIAVLPFTNESGSTDIEYLTDGMTESLINALSALPNLSVKARNTVFRYKGANLDGDEAAKVARDLSVQALLLGRVTQRGEDLRLNLELVDAASGKHIWGVQYDRKMQDLAVLQKEITQDVSQKLQTRLSTADARNLTKNYSASSEAYEDYLRGRFFWNKRSPEAIVKATEYFDRAIAKDPNFALAYAGLADSYVVPSTLTAPREVMPKAKAAAMRALQIDDSLAEAHTSLGRVLQIYEWNWNEADREFRRAIELNPRYPVAHQWYRGYFESSPDEALAERRTALELDPLSTIANFEVGRSLYLRKEFDGALEQFRKTLELDPSFPAAVQYLPLVYIQKGMPNEALETTRQIPEDSSMGGGITGYVFAVAGRQHEARQTLAKLQSLRNQRYVPALEIALVHVGLGENEAALTWLEEGYNERSFQIQFLKADPCWDPLRSDPRFAALIRRIGTQK